MHEWIECKIGFLQQCNLGLPHKTLETYDFGNTLTTSHMINQWINNAGIVVI